MKHKKIIALLMAAAVLGSLAGCKAGNKKEQPSFPDGQGAPSFETQAPVESNAQQAVGKVTSIDGTKITVENGELKTRMPGNGGSGNSKERPDKDGDNKKARPTGDGKSGNRPSFGYTFNATGGSSTFDLSGLTQITIENDDDDTPDTIEEIKTGDVVVIKVNKDGKVTSLTVKSLSGGFGNKGGNGKRTSSRDGNGKRKDRGNGNGDSDGADSEA
ncbi:MAG: hypothetical protein J5623_04875 [Clostridiales bacterium]|nr:hypothetical protein [Clostridiales bacterium]